MIHGGCLRLSNISLVAILILIFSITIVADTANASPNAYIPTRDNTVVVLDAYYGTYIYTIPVGIDPRGIAVSPDGLTAYVANYGSGTVSVIDTTSKTVKANVTVGANPYGVAINGDGSRVYVTNYGSGTVSVISTTGNQVTATIPVGLNPVGVVVSPDGTRVYVANSGTNTVSIISTADNSVTDRLVGTAPRGIAITPNGLKVYVANYGSSTVSVINTVSDTVAPIPIYVGENPTGVTVATNGRWAYVTNPKENTVSAIDTVTDFEEQEHTIPVGTGPAGIAKVPGENSVFVVNTGSNSITIIDTNSNSVRHHFSIGTTPSAFGEFIGISHNQAPVLSTIGDKVVNELEPLAFNASATDSDVPAQTLYYYLTGSVPTGASIHPATGEFFWTPTEAHGPGAYTFTIVVSDGMSFDSETINVTVNEVNQAPVLAEIGNKAVNEEATLSFTATAVDTDMPANNLTYSLVNAPAGASIDQSSGVFTWTPTEAQGPGTYTFTVCVSDGSLADTEDIMVTVDEVNTAPVLAIIGGKTVDEGTALAFTVSASDSDLPAQALTFSLAGAPTGASIDETTGAFTWTPTEAQGPNSYTFDIVVSDGLVADSETITVTVNEVNADPVLSGVPASLSCDELTACTFTASATDSDMPAQTVTFSLSGAPAGASINAGTGAFTWTPTEAQGPGSYTFSVVASDGVTTDSQSITITVNEVNVAPVLGAIGDQTVNEGEALTFTASATDSDLPAQTLIFSLSGAPAGASIDMNTGVFTWMPNEAQGPDSYTFNVVVSDGLHTDSEEITVTVNEVNQAPVLNVISDWTTNEETLLTFTATASDPDLPAQTLSFSLAGSVPAGAAIDSAGTFTWTPTEAQGPGSYTFEVVVSDGLATDSQEITITVNEVLKYLNVSSNQSSLIVGRQTAVLFTVTSADLPVEGATITLTGNATGTGLTGSSGTAVIIVNSSSAGSITITVSKAGYETEIATLKAIVPLPASGGRPVTISMDEMYTRPTPTPIPTVTPIATATPVSTVTPTSETVITPAPAVNSTPTASSAPGSQALPVGPIVWVHSIAITAAGILVAWYLLVWKK
ncbi:putative Ig domain-containing protein [Methanocella arvoryzae]|uniref:Cadherin domain-containing protein n=1 Tax=Methanocella arvoryzae (strain DSM 22066 / NBRC 105507 / MRE50) TaxID=351160 RepID=Q0W0Y5_METAR|nr:putative Ig domain-containing protein [Methanocella arvoryzae]CAJ37958.1 hypothetical protein RRC213 [Methanocella arvoryzae MRE50]